MGLGGIYAGIGLSQGLGQAGKSFIDSYQSAQESARKRQKEELEQKIAERDYRRKVESDELQEELFGDTGKEIQFKSKKETQDKPVNFGAMSAPPVQEGYGDEPPSVFGYDQQASETGLGSIKQFQDDYKAGQKTYEEKRKVGLDEFAQDANSILEQSKEMESKALKLLSLTGNANVYAAAKSLIEDFQAENAARLKGVAGNDIDKLSIIVNAVSGNQGISLDKIANNESDKDGDKDLYVLRDAQGFALGTVSPLELSSLNSKNGIKEFIKSKKEMAQKLQEKKIDLQNKLEELRTKFELDKQLHNLDNETRLQIEREGNAIALQIAKLNAFGTLDVSKTTIAHNILEKKMDVRYTTIDPKTGQRMAGPPLTDQQKILFAQYYQQANQNETDALRMVFATKDPVTGNSVANPNVNFGGFTKPVSQSAREVNQVSGLLYRTQQASNFPSSTGMGSNTGIGAGSYPLPPQ